MAAIRFPEATTFRQQFTIKDNLGAVVSLVGATLTFAVYLPTTTFAGTPVAFLTKTIGAGITVTNAVGGVLVIQFDPVDTLDKEGAYDWEIQLIEISGDTWSAGTGKLLVSPARRIM